MHEVIDILERIRSRAGEPLTGGLSDSTILHFAARDDSLVAAIRAADEAFSTLQADFPGLPAKSEQEQALAVQADFVNFYPDDAINPYVALTARGPWIVTTAGAVLHDDGGYGMLGLGHAPAAILEAMNQPHVMANVMTPSYSQLRLARALHREVGQTRGGCPYARFLAMNSGSEAVTVGARISDVNAKLETDEGGRHAGRGIKHLSLAGGFHGRTGRPARFSDSSRKTYARFLASFRDSDDFWTVAPNDLDGLREIYARAERENVFLEAFFLEPVMGEGDPGQAITPEFYRLARELTEAHGSLLLVDSIQAGLRAQGVLSIVDYPGFENEATPDMEAWSKALNAGQYPLSVLAMNERAAGLYRKGIYGNTMTANPRAMDVATAVLQAITPELRSNIRERGKEFLAKLEALAAELDGPITKVQGTGLLFSCELSPDYKAFGAGSSEEYMRRHGVGVIHGGERSLRFTPHFGIGEEEVNLVIDAVRDAVLNGPRARAAEPERKTANAGG
ncbi:MAG: aminotransferase class III-fold pyridoxal phosphate-dependent enzyme [Gammaproteobacteria bacterium]|nr:aminotransferase class III-fold pyridoxal phosphate-dependent enzyme [Gammaproteobacteria bacterium]